MAGAHASWGGMAQFALIAFFILVLVSAIKSR
jgi:hypothetical protein